MERDIDLKYLFYKNICNISNLTCWLSRLAMALKSNCCRTFSSLNSCVGLTPRLVTIYPVSNSVVKKPGAFVLRYENWLHKVLIPFTWQGLVTFSSSWYAS